MNLKIHPLTPKDIKQAVILDQKWFGAHGISPNELETLVRDYPHQTIGIFEDSTLRGFATFEILNNSLPKDYIGNVTPRHTTLFIHQFTTITNYAIDDSSADEALLEAVVEKAKELSCLEMWEALAIKHPYSTKENELFDAFDFYTAHGFMKNSARHLSWQPNPKTHIPCYLFIKTVI